MTSFLTADLHIDHIDVITYCDRPFHEVGEMRSALVAAWNTVAGSDGTGREANPQVNYTFRHPATRAGMARKRLMTARTGS